MYLVFVRILCACTRFSHRKSHYRYIGIAKRGNVNIQLEITPVLILSENRSIFGLPFDAPRQSDLTARHACH